MSNTENVRVTVMTLSRAELYRRAGLTPSPEDLLEEEFEQLFGREPDAGDRYLGLERSIEIKKCLDAIPL